MCIICWHKSENDTQIRNKILEIIRRNKKEFRKALNSKNPYKWDIFKINCKISGEDLFYFDKVIEQGIEHEDWMNEECEKEDRKTAYRESLKSEHKNEEKEESNITSLITSININISEIAEILQDQNERLNLLEDRERRIRAKNLHDEFNKSIKTSHNFIKVE